MTIDTFKQHVLPTKHLLYRVAHAIVRHSATAEDVVQEVFIKIWQQRHELSHITSWEAYGIRMVRNLAIDKTRSKHKRLTAMPEGLQVVATDTPETLTASQDTLSYIERLMLALPEKQRLIMQLRDIEQYTYEEIATTLELPMSQVKVNLHRARQKIKAQLLNQSHDDLR